MLTPIIVVGLLAGLSLFMFLVQTVGTLLKWPIAGLVASVVILFRVDIHR